MQNVKSISHQTNRSRHGLSLIEVAMSTLLVGLILVTSLKSVGSVIRHRATTADDSRALWLAQDLMNEILENKYDDPDAPPIFGAEELTGRDTWDDVDDFHLWDKTPPEERDGTVIPNLTGWRRDVTVAYVDPNNPSLVSGTDQGVKRITVRIRQNGNTLISLQALRSSGSP